MVRLISIRADISVFNVSVVNFAGRVKGFFFFFFLYPIESACIARAHVVLFSWPFLGLILILMLVDISVLLKNVSVVSSASTWRFWLLGEVLVL